MSVRFVALFSLALGLLGAGCGAGNGGVCQLDRDCASGLICCGETPSLRGVCRLPTEACAVPVDAGPLVDAPVDAPPGPDAPADAPSVPDDVPMSVDAPEPVDAGSDAPAIDSGTDAGEPDAPTVTDDAGSDAP